MCNHLSYICEAGLNSFLTHIQKVKTHCVGLQLTVVAENHASTYCAKSYRLHNWYNCPSKPCATTHPHACFSLRKSRKSQTVHTALTFAAKSSSAALLHRKVFTLSLFKFTDLWNSGSKTSCKANHNTCFQSCGFTLIGQTGQFLFLECPSIGKAGPNHLHIQISKILFHTCHLGRRWTELVRWQSPVARHSWVQKFCWCHRWDKHRTFSFQSFVQACGGFSCIWLSERAWAWALAVKRLHMLLRGRWRLHQFFFFSFQNQLQCDWWQLALVRLCFFVFENLLVPVVFHRRKIGLYLDFSFAGFPGFCIAVTYASFHVLGYFPSFDISKSLSYPGDCLLSEVFEHIRKSSIRFCSFTCLCSL